MEKQIVEIEIGGEKEEIMVGNDGRGWFAIEASWGMHDLNNIPDSWLRTTKALAVEYYLERQRDELIWEDNTEEIKAINECICKLSRHGLGEQMGKKRIEGIAVAPELYPEYFEWLSTEIDRLKKERDEAKEKLQKILKDKEELSEGDRKRRLRIISQKREIASLCNDLRTVRGDLIEARGVADQVKKSIKAKDEEIEKLKSVIRNRDGKIEGLEAAVDIQAKAIKEKDKEIERLKSAIIDKDVELVAEQAHNKTLIAKEAKIEQLEAEIDQLKEDVSRRIEWVRANGDSEIDWLESKNKSYREEIKRSLAEAERLEVKIKEKDEKIQRLHDKIKEAQIVLGTEVSSG